ncbi:hypothetical protein IQ06DRAFT_293638 [Phaeosphaeriaceae sp. SRC1lsM3a]|nr:hypothetical protein IQ06DRAFT_293638 [Stagonospora sp. SRC1lsM3a]
MQSGGFQTSSFAEQSAPFKPYRAKVQTMPADHHDDIKYNGDHFERIHLDQLEPPSSLIVPQHRASQPKRRQMQSGFLHSTRLKRKGKRQPTFRSTDKSSELTYSSPNKSSDNGPDVSNMYNCTACYKPFKNFYGWKRHEFGVHGHNDIEWVCMLDGDILLGSKCVFCTQVVYDMSHFGIHGIQVCLAKDICDRSFARKDLLKQHVLQMHGVTEAFEVPKIWSREVEFHRINPLAFWCGYCSSTFNSVDERMNHIDAHVQNGSNLGTWKAPTDF